MLLHLAWKNSVSLFCMDCVDREGDNHEYQERLQAGHGEADAKQVTGAMFAMSAARRDRASVRMLSDLR